MIARENSTKKLPAVCPACESVLNSINYTMWGTKKFDLISRAYVEDESLGSSDLEFSCPNCSVKLDPEGVIF